MAVAPLVQTSDYFAPHVSSGGNQYFHDVAVLSNGNIVFCWEKSVEAGFPVYHDTIEYRVFSPDGVPLTEEIQANTFSNGGQGSPIISALADGGFLIVWCSSGQHAESGIALYMQRFDADGLAVGGETRVTDDIGSLEYEPTVEGLADGGWVITWKKIFDRDEVDGIDNYEIFQSRFGPDGDLVLGPEPVSDISAGLMRADPQTLALADGGWLSVWWEFEAGILQARFDADGNQIGEIEVVNAPPTPEEPDSIWAKRTDPAVALLDDGGWIVVWQGSYQDGPDVNVDADNDIYFQRFAADSSKVGEQVRANPFEPGAQTDADVIGLPDGGWIIVWTDETIPDDEVAGKFWLIDRFVRAQRYTAEGEPLGEAVVIDDPASDIQHSPNIVILQDGSYLLSWYGKDFLSTESSADVVSAVFGAPSYFTAPEDGPGQSFSLTGEAGLEVVSVDTSGTTGLVTLHPDGGGFVYDPNGQFEYLGTRETATDSFELTLSDGDGGTVTEWFTIVVTGANDSPTANDDALSVSEDGPGLIDVTLNDTDPDTNDAIWVLYTSIENPGTLGTVTLAPGAQTIAYDPAGNFDHLKAGESTIETFSYVVVDAEGGQDTATVTVTINGANDAPEVTDGTAETDEDKVHQGSVAAFATDVDNDALAFAVVADVSFGNLLFAPDGSFTYTPDENFHGEDVFVYSATDAFGASETGTVTLTVLPTNDAPSGEPLILGDPRLGERLTADTSRIVDIDGLGPLEYAWFADGLRIEGVDTGYLDVGTEQFGQVISLEVSWTDLGGTAEIVTSATRGPVDMALLEGTNGNDRLFGGQFADEIIGRNGNDTLRGRNGDDVIRGGQGSDLLGGNSGDDRLIGNGARDRLFGNAGEDRLIGGSGDDVLAGGTGDDVLSGGGNADRFVFKTGWGRDTITDFRATGQKHHDRLDLSGLTEILNWKDLVKRHLKVDGDDIVIDGRNGDVILLKNVDRADLDAGDFVF